jgi:hypothetical protein
MRKVGKLWVGAACSAAFLAAGLPYWLVPYGKLNLPDALLHPGLGLVAVGALTVRLAGAASFSRSTHALGLTVPAAVSARVVVDCLHDPTAHNLWPFELVIALIVGYACALAGALAGSAAVRAMGLDAGAD